MLDKVLAIISFLAVVAFMSEVVLSVMAPDLWAVTFIVFAIAIYFLWRDLRSGDSNDNETAQGNGSDGRPAD